MVDRSKEVPIFEGPNVKAGCEKKAYRREDELLVGVWIVADHGDFGAVFDATEEDLWGIGGGVWTSEYHVVGD